MSYILAEREKVLYAKHTWISPDVPLEITNWYELTTPWRRYVAWFASEEAARMALGWALHPTCNPPIAFVNDLGWPFHRATAGKPEHTETKPIPEPAHNRRQHVVWHRGAWHKETAKGLVKFVAQEVVSR